jgi:hypothetical protein
MITLTDAALLTKKVLIVSTIMFVLILIVWGGYSYYMNFIYVAPVIEEKPTLNFGLLPKLKVPASATTTSNYSYSLDTETGDLPKDTPKLMKVYPIVPLATDLLALDRAKNLSTNLGFGSSPEMMSVSQYKFNSPTGGQLIIGVDSGNFKFKKPLASDSTELADTEDFINEEKLASDFKNFLASNDLLKDQLAEGRTKVEYDNFIKRDSKTALISLWQIDVDKYPIVTQNFKDALVKATVSKYRDEQRKYISLDYIFWPIDLDNPATYPIKTYSEAYEELTNGQGLIVVEPNSPRPSITKVYLAYYLSEEYPSYLQPVFVFEGSDFTALIPAIKSDFVVKEDSN